ncbi:RNA methyltransferase [Flavihumibacter sp. R14]|nr:RNA methyltransferase [Flavihumibacter soli]
MLSKSQISFIKSLHQKKYRKEHGLFIVEGIKSVTEFIHSDYLVTDIYCTENVMPKLANLSQKIKLHQISVSDLERITTLTTAQNILALVRLPANKDIETLDLNETFSLALDGIQDPGNLGTIIRTADWFGIPNIICSHDTVEAYNPKVVQATMGSLSRIQVIYCDLPSVLESSRVPVFGALLDGTPITETAFGGEGIIVLGNEGKGISEAVIGQITNRVTIPGLGKAESLNVAVCASLFCYELRRNILK